MSTLSLSQVKQIRALHSKKYRDKHNAFLVEGRKSIEEFVKEGWRCLHYVVQDSIQPIDGFEEEVHVTDHKTMKSISALSSASDHLAVFQRKQSGMNASSRIWVALDQLQDPGNLGTIIRTMDWFGCHHLILSEGCVDVFNPKVVQASMGSLSRVSIHQQAREEWKDLFDGRHVLFGDLQGISFTSLELTDQLSTPLGLHPMVLVMGNEGNGIHPSTRSMVGYTSITIPRGSSVKSKAESLNAAMATGIMLAHFSSMRDSGKANSH
ncbi:MAG: TrmH family RNA methyltransferase [Chitinophagales bacterium]